MASCVLCRRVPRLRYIQILRNEFTQAQHISCKPEDQADKQRVWRCSSQSWGRGLLGFYRLFYNPGYYRSVCNSANSWGQTNDDEDELLGKSLKSLYQGKPIPRDVHVDSRAFHKCRPEYASITFDLTQRPQPIEWEEALSLLQKVSILKGSMKPSDVCHFLVELSHLQPDKTLLMWNNQHFTMLLRYSVENLRFFTNLQLLEVLQSFVWLDIPVTHTVLWLYDTELSRRANQLDLRQLLYTADLWRCIGKRAPMFLQQLYDLVPLYLGEIGAPEMVQLLYIIGEGRYCPKGLIHPVQQLLRQHLQELYPEEVGVLCLGLFKSQISLPQSAVHHIIDQAHTHVKEMSDLALVNVLKYLRFSYMYHRAWMEVMVEEIPRRAPRMGVQGLMHVALACSALHYRNQYILSAIAERVPSQVPHCRSKDSSKLLWAFGSLRFLPVENPSFYPSLTEAMRHRKAEFQRYPQHLLTGLLGLSFVSHFPEDLIELALSPTFFKIALKSKELDLKKDLFTLDSTVALELPQWTGPRLSPEVVEEVTELLWKFLQSDVCQKREVREAESALQDLLGGEQFVCKRMILPHTRSIDLEVHLDSTGKPIPVDSASHKTTLSPNNHSSKFSSNHDLKETDAGVTITDTLLGQLTHTKCTIEPSEPLTPSPTVKPLTLKKRRFRTRVDLTGDLIATLTQPMCSPSAPQDTKGTVKLAIQVPSRNHYLCNSQELLGFHVLKRRHLRLAGYRVVDLGYLEWLSMLKKSRAERLAYLHGKIYNKDD